MVFCLNPAKPIPFPHNLTSPDLPGPVWITSHRLSVQAISAQNTFECLNDWCAELPLAKFTYNNTLHSTIRVSPFYTNKGYNPQPTLSLKDIPSHVAHKVAKDL
ncbi:hypothetical protein E4T56_gene12066 [Termitomyces sp. T112]|nr:hypothetical protein E4T56_gene12066 [Termitomyces sp. T112]